MKIRNVLLFAGKEVTVGPRGLMFVFIVIFPFIITFLVRLVFGDLAPPSPALGIHDAGASRVVELAKADESLEVVMFASVDALQEAVAGGAVDAALVLTADFDALVQGGARPELQLTVSGQASQIDLTIVSVSVVNLVRSVAGQPAPLEVRTVTLGDAPPTPLEERIVPLLVLIAVAFGGVFLPASTVVQEREAGTMQAVLVTPVRAGEILVGKGVVGFVLAFGVGVLTLVVNGGLAVQTLSLIVVVAIAALMSVEIGLMLGAAVSTMAALFSVWKSAGIILFAPAILFLFPGVPGWIARVFPTYYFLGPLYNIVVDGATLATEAIDLALALAICLALVPITAMLARRMETRLATG